MHTLTLPTDTVEDILTGLREWQETLHSGIGYWLEDPTPDEGIDAIEAHIKEIERQTGIAADDRRF